MKLKRKNSMWLSFNENKSYFIKQIILDSVIARVRSIENTIITVEWFNSSGDLIGAHVSQENIELFQRKTILEYLKNGIQKVSMKLILITFFCGYSLMVLLTIVN